MKKLLIALLLAVLFSGTAMGRVITGIHAHHNMSPKEFKVSTLPVMRDGGWEILKNNHTIEDECVYFDSLSEMLMALHAGKIDEIAVPWPIGEYVANTDAGTEVCGVIHSRPWHLALGFMNNDEGRRLLAVFNEALASMKSNGRLNLITAEYLGQPGKTMPQPARFVNFPGAETVKVAVTGDFPPLDIIAADGTPIGFNTAVLAELGRRAKVNIELVSMTTGARTSALTSGRVDIVFWYQVWQRVEKQPDVPDGVLLSEPYYEWDTVLHLQRALGR